MRQIQLVLICTLWTVCSTGQNVDRAIERLTDNVEREARLPSGPCTASQNGGGIALRSAIKHYHARRYARSIEARREAAALFQEIGDYYCASAVLSGAADVARIADANTEHRNANFGNMVDLLLDEAFRLAKRSTDRRDRAMNLVFERACHSALDYGSLENSLQYCESALGHTVGVGTPHRAWTHQLTGRVMMALKRPKKARMHLLKATKTYDSEIMTWHTMNGLLADLATLEQHHNRIDRSIDLLRHAVSAAEKTNSEIRVRLYGGYPKDALVLKETDT